VEIQNHKKMRVNTLFIAAFFLLFFGLGCSSLPTYEKVYVFEQKQWEQSVKPQFSVDIKDTSKRYNFTLTLRTTSDYEYSNLWIYLNTLTPDGQKAREPFEIKTTDANGAWIGKKTGTIVEHSIYFKDRKMPQNGKYVFIVEQGITKNTINEVLDIGLEVSEAKSE